MRKRHELPVFKRLNIQFDIDKLRQCYEEFSKEKKWDGLGNEYASLCESHTKLPKMFFKDEELKNVDHISDLEWEGTSYKQLSLVDFDKNYTLDKCGKEISVWQNRVALGNLKADERWFRKFKKDVPRYLHYVFKTIGNVHRTRFASLSPNSSIKPHIDYNTDYSIRIHIAIKTNDQCRNGGWDKKGLLKEVHIPADGSVWFINPGIKHFAVNHGKSERIHLIISVDSQNILAKIGTGSK